MIKGNAISLSGNEFNLIRTIDGNLVSSYVNHVHNAVNSFDVTEFQRGDVVAFRLNEEIINRKFVDQGDTLGFILSNEEQRNMIQLKGQLEVLSAELEFFTTGQKPEDVLLAKEAWQLATQELRTQEKLMERTRNLISDGVISTQEFDIEENRLMVKQLEEKIAKAKYLSVTTGEKPEQEKLVQAKIEALLMQTAQIESRLSYFTITAPFAGKISFPRKPSEQGTILTVTDTSSVVGVLPVLLEEYAYVKPGQPATYGSYKGEVVSIEDVVHFIDNRQAFFVTTTWPYCKDLRIGSMMEVKIESDSISLMKLFMRRFANNANGKS